MKNVPYKFRGVDVDSDQYVYAELGDIEYIGDNIYNFCSELYSLHNAYRESIVQLVGYDMEGNEIYEGDTVDAFCNENSEAAFSFMAQLADNITLPDPVTNIKYRVRRKADEEHSS